MTEPTSPNGSPLDLERLREVTGDDTEFETELIGIFLEGMEHQLKTLAEALSSGDAGVVRKEAHALKGASANIGACPLQQVARQLEEAAAEAQLDLCQTVWPELCTQSETLKNYLNERLAKS